MVHSRRSAALFLALLVPTAAQHDHGDHDHGDAGAAAGGSIVLPTARIAYSLDRVQITLAGPDTNWFGVAFGGTVMQDQPYAIIVDGAHEVEEVTLSAHAVTNRHGGAGLTVVSGVSEGGTYTTVIERPAAGGHAGTVFADNVGNGDLQIMMASGNSETLSYHGRSGVSTIQIIATNWDQVQASSTSASASASASADDEQGDASTAAPAANDGHDHDHGHDHGTPPSTSSFAASSRWGVRGRWATGLGVALALGR